MCSHVKPVAKLDWPEEGDLETTTVLCGGDAFLDYELRRIQMRTIRHGSSFLIQENGEDDDSSAGSRQLDLLVMSEKALEALNFYEILELPVHASQQEVKKAYHAACLAYHPDKTGRTEEDCVFLKIKAAFDTLWDEEKRKSYDSTSLEFDDSIPPANTLPEDFYKEFGPVFERNKRFDAKRTKNSPSLGSEKTPIEKVHAFYDYWIHFDSWRDFSLKAAEETETDLDLADSRYEKRWMQKEITRKAKFYKREEMARINLLVERAMALDPRLQREKEEKRQLKLEKQRQKSEAQRLEQVKAQQEKERLEKERAEQEEAERKRVAELKAVREKERKQLRKARQLFRKLVMAAHEQNSSVWDSLEDMNEDVELLCARLNAEELTRLTDALGEPDAFANGSVNSDALSQVRQQAIQTRDGVTEEQAEAERRRQEARSQQQQAEKAQKAQQQRAPWSKDELSALAKAVRKYPPGGANRWETIALFVNNFCKPQEPRTKEECIEKYNQIANAAPTTTTTATSPTKTADTGWSDEQDKQLQEGLQQYPATMDKNKRWTAIAKGVDGKNKKECVQRFKAIRAALKNK